MPQEHKADTEFDWDDEVLKNLDAAALKHKGTDKEEALIAELKELEEKLGETPSSRGTYFHADFMGGEYPDGGTEVDPNGHCYFEVNDLKDDIKLAKERLANSKAAAEPDPKVDRKSTR